MSSIAISPSMLGNYLGAGSELIILKGPSNELVIAGYASVDVIDKQNDLITLEALREASTNFMKGDYKNVMITHSNVQVGEVIDNWTDANGNVLKTGVDDTGLFVVIKMRNDIEKAREVSRDIRRGKLRSFSIGGQAMHKHNVHDPDIGTYKEIDKLELHEVTICEEGINPEAKFEIIKENKKGEDNMSEELTKALEEFNDIVNQLREQVDTSVMKEEEDDVLDFEESPVEDEMELMAVDDKYTATEEEDDVEASDAETKADSVVYGHNATGNKIEGSLTGRYDTEFSDYLSRKSESINTLDLSDENIAKAYAQYKSEREESRAYDLIKDQFESRYQRELTTEASDIVKENYDASAEVNALRSEFAELRKTLDSNNHVIAKQVEQVSTPTEVPEDIVVKMQNLHELTWEEVEELRKEVQNL